MQLQTKTHDDKWINVGERFTDIFRFLEFLKVVRPEVKKNGRILFTGDEIDN